MEERIADAVIERPAQRDLASLTGSQLSHDGAVAGDLDVDDNILLAFHMDDFLAHFGLLPAVGRQVLALIVEGLDERIFNGRTDIGESPGHAAIVTDDHVGISGKRDTGDVEIAGVQVRFIPEVRHLMAEMHVIREQRLAGDGVRSGNDPVI